MTDSQKLDLLLEKVNGMDIKVSGLDSKVSGLDSKVSELDSKVSGLEADMRSLKRRQTKYTSELKAMDEMVLDEVERVHTILNKHVRDTSVHTA